MFWQAVPRVIVDAVVGPCGSDELLLVWNPWSPRGHGMGNAGRCFVRVINWADGSFESSSRRTAVGGEGSDPMRTRTEVHLLRANAESGSVQISRVRWIDRRAISPGRQRHSTSVGLPVMVRALSWACIRRRHGRWRRLSEGIAGSSDQAWHATC